MTERDSKATAPASQPWLGGDGLLLSRLIEAHHDSITKRWLDRICADLGATPGVALTELRDGMPDYLAALVLALRQGSYTDVLRGAHSAWKDIAREHGVTRVRSGFDIGQLIHEFAVLRGVIRGVARERGEESLGVEALLADVLDAAVGEAVKAYVEARDYEARRTQAENIAFLTHELRNPLSSAMLAAAGLRQRASGVDAQLAALERSHRRLEELIDGVLESERLEADRAPSHPVDMALGEVLAPALEAARSEAQRKQLEFRTQYDPGLRVWVDPALTRSAVQNLVDNGVKYTDAGHVELSVHDGPRELSIHVRDTCHGLSPEELRTIFEPFRRGRTKKHGTGLGLSIARRAIERQGGSLHAESPEPVGCHFWIELPKRKQG